MPDGLDDVVEDLPPSCKLVAIVMEDRDQWARAPEIAEWAWLSERTVYDALSRLVDAGLVERKQALQDRRGSVYRLDSGDSDG